MEKFFTSFAKRTAKLTGSPWAFIIAFGAVLSWGISGPLFGFSDTWQLVINTSTTIITFLMVFIIQHTQNTDTEAMQIKLDELIRVTEGAHNALLDLEELKESQLDKLRDNYEKLAREARNKLRNGEVDTKKEDIHENLLEIIGEK